MINDHPPEAALPAAPFPSEQSDGVQYLPFP